MNVRVIFGTAGMPLRKREGSRIAIVCQTSRVQPAARTPLSRKVCGTVVLDGTGSRRECLAASCFSTQGTLQDLLQHPYVATPTISVYLFTTIPSPMPDFAQPSEAPHISRTPLRRAELAERVQALLLAGGESDMAIASTRAVAAMPFGTCPLCAVVAQNFHAPSHHTQPPTCAWLTFRSTPWSPAASTRCTSSPSSIPTPSFRT